MLRRTIWATLFALVMGTAAVAAPCTNNAWQPTFVHDLDTDDAPFFVTPSLSFVPLQWVPNGGYVPHACQLVRGPQDTRDPRGFTTCQDYTRVQCGCSRSIPCNSTCAAFLRWRSAQAQPQPGLPPGAGATRQPPRAAAAISVPTSPMAWRQAPQYRGAIYGAQFGLVLQGGPWTNGRLQNGAYDGNRIFSAQTFDLSGGGDVYMRFLANGAGQYMGFWPRLFEGVSVLHMTTHHSWANSVVVPDNGWVYAHLRVEPDHSYRIAISSGTYDDRGGGVIYRNAGQLANLRGRLELHFADNYAGPQASMTLGEAIVRTGNGMPGAAQPSRPGVTPRGPGGTGAMCSAPSDCASSVCLLGVCAPPSR